MSAREVAWELDASPAAVAIAHRTYLAAAGRTAVVDTHAEVAARAEARIRRGRW